MFCSLPSGPCLALAHHRPSGFVLGEADGRRHRALGAAGGVGGAGLPHILGLSHWRYLSRVLRAGYYVMGSKRRQPPTLTSCCGSEGFVGAGGVRGGERETRGGAQTPNAQNQAHSPARGEIGALGKHSPGAAVRSRQAYTHTHTPRVEQLPAGQAEGRPGS